MAYKIKEIRKRIILILSYILILLLLNPFPVSATPSFSNFENYVTIESLGYLAGRKIDYIFKVDVIDTNGSVVLIADNKNFTALNISSNTFIVNVSDVISTTFSSPYEIYYYWYATNGTISNTSSIFYFAPDMEEANIYRALKYSGVGMKKFFDSISIPLADFLIVLIMIIVIGTIFLSLISPIIRLIEWYSNRNSQQRR